MADEEGKKTKRDLAGTAVNLVAINQLDDAEQNDDDNIDNKLLTMTPTNTIFRFFAICLNLSHVI